MEAPAQAHELGPEGAQVVVVWRVVLVSVGLLVVERVADVEVVCFAVDKMTVVEPVLEVLAVCCVVLLLALTVVTVRELVTDCDRLVVGVAVVDVFTASWHRYATNPLLYEPQLRMVSLQNPQVCRL